MSIFQPATLGTTASRFRTGSGTLSSSTRTLEGHFLQRSPFISSHSHSHSVLYSSIRNSDIGIGATVPMRSQIPMAFIQILSMQKRKKEDMIEKKIAKWFTSTATWHLNVILTNSGDFSTNPRPSTTNNSSNSSAPAPVTLLLPYDGVGAAFSLSRGHNDSF